MKKLFLSSLAVLASASVASAADIRPYAGVNFGYEHAAYNDVAYHDTFTSEDFVYSEKGHVGNVMGDGFTTGAAAGLEYRACDVLGLRGEVEYMYSRINNATLKTTDGDITEKIAFDSNTHALLLNVYTDFHNTTAFTPYLTAGLGWGWSDVREDSNDTEDGSLRIKDNGLAWQVGAGVSYSVTDALNLDLGYRFVKLADIEDKSSEVEDDGIYYSKMTVTPMMHQVRLGARYAF